MKYTITKLDESRPVDAGDIAYGYMLRFIADENARSTGMIDFHHARKFLMDTYGWSDIGKDDGRNEHWAWMLMPMNFRIYLRSEKELMWFTLKYPSEISEIYN